MADRPDADSTLSASQVAKLLAAVQKRPELSELAWEGEAEPLAPPADAPAASDAGVDDPVRRRIRDRYIGVRFAGVARSGDDLRDSHRVIKAARLAFEEERPDSALELLELAIEQDGREPALWLAQLEILFLARAASRFAACARAFRAAFPDSGAWEEVTRLGRALAPDEPLFAAARDARDNHYGPWPDLPNWIEASWDLTSEVRAADFHRAMTAERPILIA